MPADPLSAEQFDALIAPLGPFESAPRLGVAVSGGADSLALALLADRWARGRGGEAVALTVDHGLRPQSGEEAARVRAWLSACGVAHRILTWDGPKPAADIQAAARAARYRLLGDWCRAAAVLHLLLAHHQDDQAETVLLRLGRGAGLDGLAAMAPVQETAWGRLLRPLLGVGRARLAATLEALGQPWIEDPSNRNPAFSRVRLRALLPALAAEGLTAERLGATAARLGRARAAVEQAVAAAAAEAVTLHPAGYGVCEGARLAALPDEVGLRLLSRLLLAVGGGGYTPRLARLERLYAEVRRGLAGARTLAGCRVEPLAGGRLLVCREAARVAPPAALVPGTELVWDGRFRLLVAEDAPVGLKVGALGRGWKSVVERMTAMRVPAIPAAARASLPALYADDGISAVPHLGYNREMACTTLRSMVLAPPLPLTVAGHCLV